ncbi:alpha-amylase family glycosyl hydrolase [Niabella terrae]
MTLKSHAVDWRQNASIYEVNVRQYTPEGTFEAFAASLPRLKDMGVQVLWLMPVTPIAQEKMKGSLGSYYACSDYTAINPEFGNLEDFKKLVDRAHALGLKLIIDWVANHTGWDHVWTRSHPDYYLKDTATGTFQIASGMDDIIELNYDNPELRQAMIQAMKFWVEQCDIDGFRCDLASWVPVDFWREARPQLDALKPLFWLGEFDELENPEYGAAFDASYSWKWMHATRDFYQQHQPLTGLLELLQQYNQLGDSSMRAWFTTNHDENSWNGTEYEKYGAMAPSLAVFSATWNGIPLVYSGQELPLKDKRLAFFDRDPIPWTGRFGLHDFYKRLLELHHENPALSGGDPSVTTHLLNHNAPDKVLAYIRRKEAHAVLVLLNWSAEALQLELQDAQWEGQFKEAFTGETLDADALKSLQLEPWAYRVYVR